MAEMGISVNCRSVTPIHYGCPCFAAAVGSRQAWIGCRFLNSTTPRISAGAGIADRSTWSRGRCLTSLCNHETNRRRGDLRSPAVPLTMTPGQPQNTDPAPIAADCRRMYRRNRSSSASLRMIRSWNPRCHTCPTPGRSFRAAAVTADLRPRTIAPRPTDGAWNGRARVAPTTGKRKTMKTAGGIAPLQARKCMPAHPASPLSAPVGRSSHPSPPLPHCPVGRTSVSDTGAGGEGESRQRYPSTYSRRVRAHQSWKAFTSSGGKVPSAVISRRSWRVDRAWVICSGDR